MQGREGLPARGEAPVTCEQKQIIALEGGCKGICESTGVWN